METNNYFGLFKSKDDIATEFSENHHWRDEGTGATKEDILAQLVGANVLFASYGYENYQGDAAVIYEKNGALYEAAGSHCSCYGLGGQWDPKPITWAYLAMQSTHFGTDRYDSDARTAALESGPDGRKAWVDLINLAKSKAASVAE